MALSRSDQRLDEHSPPTLAVRAERTQELLATAADEADEGERRRVYDEVVTLNVGLARSVAARFRGRGEAYDDLVQVACIGLLKAVQQFDPSRGRDFAAYAVPTMAGELKRHFRDHGWMVRPPRRLQELRLEIRDAIPGMTQRLCRSPRVGELAAELGADEDDVIEALGLQDSFSPASLDAPAWSSEGQDLADLVATIDPGMTAADARLTVAPVVAELDPRAQRILYLRFTLGWTQEQIAGDIGVTQMQVSRLLTKILLQLRDRLSAN